MQSIQLATFDVEKSCGNSVRRLDTWSPREQIWANHRCRLSCCSRRRLALSGEGDRFEKDLQADTSLENSAGGEVMEKNRRQFKRGDSVRVSLPVGQIVEATIKAVIESTEGVQLQVDFGHEQTALVHERDVISE
jgi:hypothetical protein